MLDKKNHFENKFLYENSIDYFEYLLDASRILEILSHLTTAAHGPGQENVELRFNLDKGAAICFSGIPSITSLQIPNSNQISSLEICCSSSKLREAVNFTEHHILFNEEGIHISTFGVSTKICLSRHNQIIEFIKSHLLTGDTSERRAWSFLLGKNPCAFTFRILLFFCTAISTLIGGFKAIGVAFVLPSFIAGFLLSLITGASYRFPLSKKQAKSDPVVTDILSAPLSFSETLESISSKFPEFFALQPLVVPSAAIIYIFNILASYVDYFFNIIIDHELYFSIGDFFYFGSDASKKISERNNSLAEDGAFFFVAILYEPILAAPISIAIYISLAGYLSRYQRIQLAYKRITSALLPANAIYLSEDIQSTLLRSRKCRLRTIYIFCTFICVITIRHLLL